MILGIDGNEANVSEKVGVSYCVWNQLRVLSELESWKVGKLNLHSFKSALTKPKEVENKSRLKIRVFLKDSANAEMPKENDFFRYVVVPKKTLWSQFDLPLVLFTKHRDLDYFLAPAHYAPRFCPCKTIVIVHDLSYFYYPSSFLKKDLYQLKHWTEYSVKQAQRVIAVSEVTKQDLIKNYQLSEQKITVIHNGWAQGSLTPLTEETHFGGGRTLTDLTRQPYFLYIGTLQKRKNLVNLILGFAKLQKTYPQYRLFLVGKKGWLYDELFTLVKNYRLEQTVIFPGYLDEPTKQSMLSGANALVLPGFYEGFGLPILEAFALGVPVLLANSGALP
jgi:glycosyltransferase involved in cell wall biosynthesis